MRALPSDIQRDRVARPTVSAGEPVDLLNINGLFIRAWVRDNRFCDVGVGSGATGRSWSCAAAALIVTVAGQVRG
jgi:hypothetical protein